ncbi:hypothetical protein NQZ68_022796 [Dissostichus eleginoides]|nr:hypothetical protein NQZ68_022796 [Dissostichus eleginoides]
MAFGPGEYCFGGEHSMNSSGQMHQHHAGLRPSNASWEQQVPLLASLSASEVAALPVLTNNSRSLNQLVSHPGMEGSTPDLSQSNYLQLKVIPIPALHTLQPGALEQGEDRHGGLTDIHVGQVNVPYRHRALERYVPEN